MLTAAVILSLLAITAAQKTCSISLKNGTTGQVASLSSPAPLLLKPGGSLDGFGFLLPPNTQGIITLKAGEQVLLACVGTKNYIEPLGTSVQEISISCVSGENFIAGNRPLTLRQLTCKTNPIHTARASNKVCNNDKGEKIGIMIEIGFSVQRGFYKLIDICFDDMHKNPLYSRFDLVAGISGGQSAVRRQDLAAAVPSFYPGMNPNELYRLARENATFNQLLSPIPANPSTGTTTRNRTVQRPLLAKGRLTTYADFVYRNQRRATSYFVNVVPQWDTINEKNWNNVASEVRSYAATRNVNLEVYTGTHGVYTLNNGKELYLHEDSRGGKFLPVPKLLWKVVYNAREHAGIAIISVNNPYFDASKPNVDYKICPEIHQNMTWLRINNINPTSGYTYCCDVNRFREKVNFLPNTVTVTKLLV